MIYTWQTVQTKWMNSLCGALRDLVPFVQLKKREKHPWRSVNFSKVAGFKFFKLYKWYQIVQRITYGIQNWAEMG